MQEEVTVQYNDISGYAVRAVGSSVVIFGPTFSIGEVNGWLRRQGLSATVIPAAAV